MTDVSIGTPQARTYHDYHLSAWRRLLLTRETGVIFALVVVYAVAAATVANFASQLTLTYLLLDAAATLFIALPMTMIIATGEIDLSVASVVGLSSVVVGVMYQAGAPMALA